MNLYRPRVPALVVAALLWIVAMPAALADEVSRALDRLLGRA